MEWEFSSSSRFFRKVNDMRQKQISDKNLLFLLNMSVSEKICVEQKWSGSGEPAEGAVSIHVFILRFCYFPRISRR